MSRISPISLLGLLVLAACGGPLEPTDDVRPDVTRAPEETPPAADAPLELPTDALPDDPPTNLRCDPPVTFHAPLLRGATATGYGHWLSLVPQGEDEDGDLQFVRIQVFGPRGGSIAILPANTTEPVDYDAPLCGHGLRGIVQVEVESNGYPVSHVAVTLVDAAGHESERLWVPVEEYRP